MNKVNLLFVCSENSASSQMAEALARHFYAEQFDISSTGDFADTRQLLKSSLEFPRP
ncbi:low molecular weight phosphatase family protein [Aestuariirhabdus sp. LZHN29]|uniref:arsenate-mycothiol transferase ArsC n=1 Tax=Aestuariirhabdus sp. LZHN29 TaxID=3417462 RepID=UPI003CF6D18A